MSAWPAKTRSAAYEEHVPVRRQLSGLSRAAELLQVVARQARRTRRLLLVPFRTREMGCDEIR